MSNGGTFNLSTYESAKEYLKTSMEHVIAAGHDVKAFSEFTLEKFGDKFNPYLRHFLGEVQSGSIKIKGLTKTATQKIAGRQVSPEERDAMIREAAYLRAEKRGFVGGSPDEDWTMAEQEIDAMLAKEAGLIDKGRQAVHSATEIIEKEFNDLKNVVHRWVEQRHGQSTETAPAKKPAKRTVAAAPKKKAPAAEKTTVKTETPVKKEPVKAAEEKKQAVDTKPAAKKETVKAAAAEKKAGASQKKTTPKKKASAKKAETKKAESQKVETQKVETKSKSAAKTEKSGSPSVSG